MRYKPTQTLPQWACSMGMLPRPLWHNCSNDIVAVINTAHLLMLPHLATTSPDYVDRWRGRQCAVVFLARAASESRADDGRELQPIQLHDNRASWPIRSLH